MSNLFGGLFEAAQKARLEKVRAKREEEKRAQKPATTDASSSDKSKKKADSKPTVKNGKRKKEEDSEEEADFVATEPAKKKVKMIEDTDPTASAKDSQKVKGAPLISKKSKSKDRADSSDGDNQSFDSDASGMFCLLCPFTFTHSHYSPRIGI